MNFIIAVPFMGRIPRKIALALAKYSPKCFKSDFSESIRQDRCIKKNPDLCAVRHISWVEIFI